MAVISTSTGTATVTIAGTVTVDGSGVTQPVSGTVSVGNFPATQAVSVATLPLPAGAATDSTLTDGSQRVGGVVIVDGSAVTQPVSGRLDRVWSLDRELDSVDVGTPEVMQGSSPWRVDGSAVVQPVSGAFYQPVQPVSAGSLPLPAGAATDATAQAQLATLNEIAWQAILASERMVFS